MNGFVVPSTLSVPTHSSSPTTELPLQLFKKITEDSVVSTTSCVPTQISPPPVSQPLDIFKGTPQDEWLSNVTRIFAETVKSDPTINSDMCISAYWMIFKDIIKDLIDVGTDMTALKTVSTSHFVFLSKFSKDLRLSSHGLWKPHHRMSLRIIPRENCPKTTQIT